MHSNLEPTPLRDDSPPTRLTPFIYQSFEEENQIRLLRVRNWTAASSPASRSSTESGQTSTSCNTDLAPSYELVIVSLDAVPSFEAISYAWGSDERTHYVYIRNSSTPSSGAGLLAESSSCEAVVPNLTADAETMKRMGITTSIATALPQLISTSRTGHLWIDQICINQSSITERNHQVRLMDRVYSAAERVLIWTGPDFPALRRIARRGPVDSEERLYYLGRSPFHLIVSLEQLSDGSFADDAVDAIALCTFFGRSWFERAWVVQEAVLARDPIVLAGAFELGLSGLQEVIDRWQWMLLETSRTNEVLTIYRRRKQLIDTLMEMRTRRTRPFYSILNLMAPQKTSNPRDHVYAFLGMKVDGGITLNPDYALEVSQVFTEAAKAIIDGTQILDLFELLPVGLRGGIANSRVVNNLPSWVPNWAFGVEDSPLTRYLGDSMPLQFNAARGYLYQQRQHGTATADSSNNLTVFGKIVDVITDSFLSPRIWTHSIQPGESQGLSLPKEVIALVDSRKILGSPEDIVKRLFRVSVADWLMMRKMESRFVLSRSGLDALVESVANARVQPDEWPPIIDRHKDMMYHSLFLSRSGKFGLGPGTLEQSDEVAILHGSKLPVILRPKGLGKYSLVGQCYLEDFMYGDGVTWDEDGAEPFILV